MPAPQHNDPVLVIGTGLAGYNLVREFRKHDAETPVCLLTADDGRSYSKPMLSAAFQKHKDATTLAMATPGRMAEQLAATVRTHTRVTALDPAAHRVFIDDEPVTYSKLVIAWGARVLRAPLQGDAADRVVSVNDLTDYGRFRAQLDGRRRVFIMGAGLIGCEFASDLVHAGFEVELAAPDNHLLQLLVPEAAGKALRGELEAAGVKIDLGPAVVAVEQADGPDGPLRVLLSDGSAREADVVVSAIGLRPRIDLAAAAGLTVGRGIIVDQTLAASAPDVYALGDCAEVCGHSLQYVLPLMAGARALGKTLAGTPTPVHYPPMPVTVKTPLCPVVALPPPADVDGEWMIESSRSDVRALFRDPAGILRGFVLTGEWVKDKFALVKEIPDLLPA